MSKDLKEFNEDGVFYNESSKSVYTRSRKMQTAYKTPVLQKLNATTTVVSTERNIIFSQTRNSNTGHWIRKNEISGELIISNGTRPFKGVAVRRNFRAAMNPSINKETAEMAEKAVLAVMNRSLVK